MVFYYARVCIFYVSLLKLSVMLEDEREVRNIGFFYEKNGQKRKEGSRIMYKEMEECMRWRVILMNWYEICCHAINFFLSN